MSIHKKAVGITLASAAAALFIAGATASVVPSAAKASGEVKCAGLNDCKGQSACASATNSCKGLNDCKGHGWLPAASADECTMKGGSVIE